MTATSKLRGVSWQGTSGTVEAWRGGRGGVNAREKVSNVCSNALTKYQFIKKLFIFKGVPVLLRTRVRVDVPPFHPSAENQQLGSHGKANSGDGMRRGEPLTGT